MFTIVSSVWNWNWKACGNKESIQSIGWIQIKKPDVLGKRRNAKWWKTVLQQNQCTILRSTDNLHGTKLPHVTGKSHNNFNETYQHLIRFLLIITWAKSPQFREDDINSQLTRPHRSSPETCIKRLSLVSLHFCLLTMISSALIIILLQYVDRTSYTVIQWKKP